MGVEMTYGRRIGWIAGLLALAVWPWPVSAPAQQPDGVAARVGGEVITLSEVTESVKKELAKLDEQRHAVIEQRLEQMIDERLIIQEAKKQGLSVEDLMKREVLDKTPETSDAEATAFITQNRARLPKMDEAQLRLRVKEHLRGQKAAQLRQTWVQGLREKSVVTVSLPAPPIVRHTVSADGGPVKGGKDAPVTIVEFSDFQCPFCKNVNATLQQVLDRYPGKVRLVFRDYPLVQLHPGAPKAHEAARCAADQGKFWEYHDVLFARSPRHAPQDLKQYAQELKLDAAAFDSCLDGNRHAAAVGADLQEGARLGVTGTPSFFINGRALQAAQPFTAFQKIIDSELRQ
jgi:protein-disulfide isomerase